MKRYFLSITVVLFFFTYCYSQQAEQRFNALLGNGDYIEINRQYSSAKDNLSPLLKAMVEPCLSYALNKPEDAVGKIDYLLKNHANDLGGMGVLNFISMLADQLYAIGEYREAANTIEGIIQSLESQNAPKELIEPMKIIYKKNYGLRNIPKCELSRIPGQSHKVKLVTNLKGAKYGWYIPVNIHGKIEPFLFDTGAGGNLISESFAKKYGVKIVADSIPLLGIGSGYTKIGVIDSLTIGNIIYRNVIVNVGKDNEILPQRVSEILGFKIDAILGIEFMKAVGYINIKPKENTIEFSESADVQETTEKYSNMMISSNAPCVEAFSDNIRLLLTFDTGANSEGYITSDFWGQHRKFFEHIRLDKKDTVKIGGFAGTNLTEVYKIPNFPLRIGDNKKVLKRFIVQNRENTYSGSLGIDYFKLCNEIILDFNNMFFIAK